MFLKTKSFLCYKVLLVRLACLVRFQARVRLLVHAWYFRLLSRLCWCPVRPNFGRTQARHLPGSPTQSKTFFCQVHVWLMFDSKNGIPARVRLDYVSVWFKNFVRELFYMSAKFRKIRRCGSRIPNIAAFGRHFDYRVLLFSTSTFSRFWNASTL